MVKKHKIFSRNPLIWFHYIPLVGILFLARWISDITGLEGVVLTNPLLGYSLLAVYYFIWFSIGDQLIHYVIGAD